jgi:hypothetical protein
MRYVESVEKECLCGTKFFVKPGRAKRAKFCSVECRYFFYTKATGFKRKDKGYNSSWFKKGVPTWNAGTVGICKANSGSIKPGQRLSVKTEFSLGHVSVIPREKRAFGERHPLWKGTEVGYNALHAWVAREKGSPKHCIHCGAVGNRRHIHWANKSRKYKRHIDDWISLCVRCHIKHDKNTRGAIKRNFEKGARLCAA